MDNEFESVWEAIEDIPEQAAKMRVRSSLLMKISEVVNGWDMPQTVAAKVWASRNHG